jgi:hypothetical protein
MELAGQLLEETLRTEIDEMRAAYLDRKPEYPPEWRSVLGNYTAVLHVTPEELEDFQKEMVEFFARYRRLSPDERPPGAKRVSVLIDFNPWFAPDEPAGESS